MSKTQSRVGITIPKIPEVIDVTYATLTTLIGGNNLVVGQKYKITDYQTVHTIPGTADTNIGPTEPLIVTALTTNNLEPIAYSTLHPDDIIYYTHTNGSTEFPGSTKGFITRRIDTAQNNDIGTDWRYCKYRRYKIAEDTWNAGTSYSIRSVVKSTVDNTLYYSRRNSNLNNPVTDKEYWALIPLINNSYTGVDPTSWTVALTPITTDPLDYEDYVFFAGGYDTSIRNNTIATYALMNTVLFQTFSFEENNIGANFNDNTLLGTVSNNRIGADFVNNLVSTIFNNIIDSQSQNNVLGSMRMSKIGSSFSNNILSTISINQDNIIGSSFSQNIISTNFSSNRIGTGFVGNVIGTHFYDNYVESNVKYLLTKSATLSSNGFQNNYIQSDFSGTSLAVPYDFTASTFVYTEVKTEIYRRLDLTYKLRYTDNTDALIVVAPNA